MKHRGELLNQVINKLGIRKGYLAAKLGVHRNTITNLIQTPNIPDQKMKEIGMVINYNFSEEIPELGSALLAEPKPHYMPKGKQPDYRAELIDLQQKYIDLQEKYIDLMAKLAGVK